MASEVGGTGPVGESEVLDPGWGKALRPAITGMLLPTVDIKRFVPRDQRAEMPILTEMRANWIRIAIAQSLMFLFVAIVGGSGPRPKSPPMIFAVITAVGVAVGSLICFVFRDLRIPKSGSLAHNYLIRLQLRSAGAMLPVLLGILGVFATGHVWILVGGWLAAVIMLALVAPTGKRIDRDQQHLNEKGCCRSLWSDLLEPRKS